MEISSKETAGLSTVASFLRNLRIFPYLERQVNPLLLPSVIRASNNVVIVCMRSALFVELLHNFVTAIVTVRVIWPRITFVPWIIFITRVHIFGQKL